MSGLFPQPVTQMADLPSRSLGTLPTSAPSHPTVLPSAAHGKMPDTACLMVEVNKACIISIYIFMPTTNTWKYPGSNSAQYQKTFSEVGGGFDFFEAPAGARFYLVSDTASTTAYVSDPGLNP